MSEVFHLVLASERSIHILILQWRGRIHKLIYSVYVTHPVHHSQIHPQSEHSSTEMDSLGDIAEQLMVEALYPVSITTL